MEGDSYGGGVLCPQRFTELYEEHVGRRCVWEVRLHLVGGLTDPESIVKLLRRVDELEAELATVRPRRNQDE